MLQAFIGSGVIEVAAYDASVDFYSRAFRDIGNNTAFNYSTQVQERNLASFRSPAGGTFASAPRIDTVSGQIDCRSFNPDNLALALWGAKTSAAATAITGEAHVLHAGKFVPTKRLINTGTAPVVKKGATTLDTDDYTVSEHGITFAATLTTVGVADGDAITVDYTPKATIDVNALIASAPLVSIFLRGFDAVSGEPHTMAIWKAKMGAPSQVDKIGDDFGTLALPFTIEQDTTIVGAGLSQYFLLQQASA